MIRIPPTAALSEWLDLVIVSEVNKEEEEAEWLRAFLTGTWYSG